VRRALATLFVILLLAPFVYSSTPQLWKISRLSVALMTKPWHQRRTIILGPWYADIREIRRIIPEAEYVAVIPRRPEDLDAAVFAIYHLYPRSTRLFRSWPDWQQNQHEGLDRSVPPPSWIVVVNGTKTPALEVTHYVNGEYLKVPLR
jgi:hypothetical protein